MSVPRGVCRGYNHFPRGMKGMAAMRKLLMTCLAIAFASAALVGCKVEGEVDPDGDVSSNVVLPR